MIRYVHPTPKRKSGMDVTVLGSGTAIPSAERASPGYFVQVANESLLLDGGTGTLHQLVRAGVRLGTLDRVLYNHYHPDHVGAFSHLLGELSGSWVPNLPFVLELNELKAGTVDFGAWRLTARPVPHTDVSLAHRIQAPHHP